MVTMEALNESTVNEYIVTKINKCIYENSFQLG
jgi:hypothetical protein